MTTSRRLFLKTAAATGTLAAVPSGAVSAKHGALRADDIRALFAQLPGDVAFKIVAPDAKGKKAFVAQQNPDRMLFVASAIKTFALCEALRQADSEDVVATLEEREVALDSTIWSLGSPTFDPPNLTGVVSERTALEAMITTSSGGS